jgi:hypothetical protein
VAEVVIDPRFRGPDESGNGGYSCGLFARAAPGVAEVTLRLPPPLGVPLRVKDGRVLDGEALVAEVAPGEIGGDVPEPPSWEDAQVAEQPDLDSPFPNCFVCGHARGPDGLHVHPGSLHDGRVAATWVPRADAVAPEFVWAALDCPGGYATGVLAARGVAVLGRLVAEVRRVPEPGERCVVLGWSLGSDGRKHFAGTAVFSGPEVLGVARATWIEPRG